MQVALEKAASRDRACIIEARECEGESRRGVGTVLIEATVRAVYPLTTLRSGSLALRNPSHNPIRLSMGCPVAE